MKERKLVLIGIALILGVMLLCGVLFQARAAADGSYPATVIYEAASLPCYFLSVPTG